MVAPYSFPTPVPSTGSIASVTAPGGEHPPFPDSEELLVLLARSQELDYKPVPTASDNPKALAYPDDGSRQYCFKDWLPGMGVNIRAGLLSTGYYLSRLDIDRSAHEVVEAILTHLSTIKDKIHIQRSTTGRGLDILFLSPISLINNQRLYWHNSHVGEVHCDGGRCAIWGIEDVEALSRLTPWSELELDQLRSILSIQEGTRRPGSWTHRYREVCPMIEGWDQVAINPFFTTDGMPLIFAGKEVPHQIARANLQRLRHAQKGERSEALANVTQSFMLLADHTYGRTIADKCRTVAAIVIALNPKQGDKGYDAEKDVAALIGHILNADPFVNGRGHFRRPYWANTYCPPRRPRHRPLGDQASQLNALRRLLERCAEGLRVERLPIRQGFEKLTVKALARRLHVGIRTIRRYLQILETKQEIVRDHVSGRGGRLIVSLTPWFGNGR